MIRAKKIIRYLVPHVHADGSRHRAHAIGMGALVGYLQVLIFLTLGLFLMRAGGLQILGVAKFTTSEIIEMTNAKRAENGLAPLAFNEKLSAAASEKANDIYANNYWAHNSPSGKTPWDFITAVDYQYIFAGENLARDFTDADSVVRAWMDSSSHRSNLLDKNFKEIGVAVASGKLGGREGTLVVQMFGASRESPPSTIDQSPLTIDQKQECQMSNVKCQMSATENQSVTVLASRHMAIARTVSLGLTGLVFGLFLVEVWVSARRADMQIRGGIFAHLAILGFVLLAVWYAAQGAIL